MGSQRFPGKHMCEVAGKPLLMHLLDRVRQSKLLTGLVVATPDTPPNDTVEEFCQSYGVPCFRGSEDDVTDRMIKALENQNADIGAEVYGDCILTDPAILDLCIGEFLKGGYDFVGNGLKETFPSGTYVEVFSMQAFRKAAAGCNDLSIREHGTYCLRLNPGGRYRIRNIEAQGSLRRSDLHLDLDYPEDFEVVKAILEHFAPRSDMSTEEIITFLDAHPEIARINQNVHRRWRQCQQDIQRASTL
ncbi:hypothetical protein A2635_00755 [Candidatus Peribacteria bacterium RIFCSPHIGHO2_01_FULL_51_9]|nr:MAG: hypothetical protein A2635_00755 [Candidatus Peribacteria bacterium RIFCSPHIGHO2_01_FULL_51_9]